jgi:dihydrofolate reductase
MGKELILKMSMSVDGFVGGPNGEMDWAFPSMSDAGRQRILELLASVSLQVIGRRTYEGWIAYWPTATNPIARPMNELPKAVFSRTGTFSVPSVDQTTADPAVLDSWLNPIVAGKDLVADIQRLKAEEGKPMLAHGGASFASSLIAANLVDVFHLVVHPVVLGRGLPIFAGLENPLHLKLEELRQTDTGVVVKTYRPV